MLSRVIDQMGLREDPEFNGHSGFITSIKVMLGFGQSDDPELAALRNLRSATSVKRNERSFVIDISVSGSYAATGDRPRQCGCDRLSEGTSRHECELQPADLRVDHVATGKNARCRECSRSRPSLPIRRPTIWWARATGWLPGRSWMKPILNSPMPRQG